MRQHMMRCKSCGEEIAKPARTCPHCGAKNRKPLYMRAWFILLIVISLLFTIRLINVARNQQTHEKAGYGVLQFEDGTTATARELNAQYDESAVSAENMYVGKTVRVTLEVTNISSWAIEDAISLIRFSYSDYILAPGDYDILSSLREGDIIQVIGRINAIGGGNWYVQLDHITQFDRVE